MALTPTKYPPDSTPPLETSATRDDPQVRSITRFPMLHCLAGRIVWY